MAAGNPFAGTLGNPFAGTLSSEDEWEKRGPLLVNRRTGKVRPAPLPRGAQATVTVRDGKVQEVGPPADPLAGEHPHASFARRTLSAAARAAAGVGDLYELGLRGGEAVRDRISGGGMVLDPKGALRESAPLPARASAAAPEPIVNAYEKTRDDYLASGIARGASPLRMAAADTLAEAVGAVGMDPTNLVDPGNLQTLAVLGARRALREGGEAAARTVADDVARTLPPAVPGELVPRTPGWAANSAEGAERFADFARSRSGRWRAHRITPDDLPFELRDLPLTRWESPAGESLNLGGEFHFVGDDVSYGFGGAGEGGSRVRAETFTPERPLVVVMPQEPPYQPKLSALLRDPRGELAHTLSGGDDWWDYERRLLASARRGGHDAVVMVGADGQVILAKLPEAKPGAPRTSPDLEGAQRYREALASGERSPEVDALGERVGAVREEQRGQGTWRRHLPPQTPGQRALASAQGREAIASSTPVAARNTGVVAAMPHAGSDVSPEAMARVARGERYVRVTPGGEVLPIVNDVAAVDVRVNPGEVKAVLGADGMVRVEQGRPNAAQARALSTLEPAPPPLREAPEPAVYEITDELDDETADLLGLPRRTNERSPAPDPGLLGRAASEPGPAGELRPLEPPAPGVREGEQGFVSTAPARRLADWWRENFSGGGPGQGRFNVAAREFADPAQRELVAGIPYRIERMEGRHAAALFDKDQLLKEADRVAREVAPSRKGRRELYRNMQRAINGDLPLEEIPAPMRPFLGRAGDLVEQLSWKGVDEGALPAEIVSGGSYRHRAYRAFEDPDWIDKVRDTPDWYAARDYLKKELPDAPDEEILGIMQQLAHREHGPEAITLVAQGAPTRINAILKERKAIPEPLRRLMGEHDDFRVALEKTVHNLAWDIESYRFWKELGDDAVAAGVFREKGSAPTELLYRSLPGSNAVAGISSRSPVEGMLTSDSLKQALLAQFEATKISGWQQLAGVVKSNKTVLSVQTHGRNTISHIFSITANGHAPRIAVRLPEYVRAFRSQATRRRAVELGIMGDGALSGEVEDYIRWMEESANPLVRAQKRVTKKAAKAYRVEDDVPRYLQWMAETEDRMWALDLPRPEAEVLAADIIRDTAQTYSRAPQIARRLSRNPVVGSPGVTFTFESFRNVKNIARQGARDLAEGVRTGNGRLIALAGKRYASLVGGALVASATVKAIRDRAAGMDAGEEEAMRRLVVPHYNKNAQLVPVGWEKGKSVTYFDMGFINPYSAILKPAIAAQRAIDSGAPAAGVLWELLNGVAGGDILAETAAEAAFGQRVSQMWPPEMGGKTYLESDPPRHKLAEIAQTIYRGAAPGTALTAERILRASGVLPNRSRSGQVFEPKKEVLALAGPRVTKMEIPTAYRRTMGEVGGLLGDALSMAKLNAREDGPREAAERYLGNYVALYEAARQAAEDGRSLGMEREALRELAKTVPADVLADAIDGIKRPPMPRLKSKNPADGLLILQIEAAYLRRYK